MTTFHPPGHIRRLLPRAWRDLGPEDFGHPQLPAGHPLRWHVLYRLANPRAADAAVTAR